MRHIRGFLLVAPLLLFSAAVSRADTVTGSGTWASTAPTTTESAPGATWSFSFMLSDPATDAFPDGGGYLTSQFSDFTYSLGGVAISPTLTNILFFPTSENGMFDLTFSNGDVVSIYGAQVYAGSPPPGITFIGGVYAVNIAMMDAVIPTGSGTVTIATAATTPEPATLALLAFGAIALALLRKKVALP